MFDVTTKAPGVYIEEITPAGPIEGAGTSTAAFIGQAKKQPADADLGKPVLVTNWTQFTERFDSFEANKHLAYAVRGFFDNGGTVVYIVPTKDLALGTVQAALTELTRLPDVSIVCAPGLVDAAVQTKVVDHCGEMGDRFAILDGVQTTDPTKADGPLLTQRGAVTSTGGFGALYWPWIKMADPLAPPDKPGTTTRPPSGHIAGIFARSDNQRGVHKAPANEAIRGAVDLDFQLNDTEQGILNNKNVNCLRAFPGRPPMVWGARTLTDGTPWRYVNVRRLFSFVEDSLLQGLRWAIFEPNNPALWKGLSRTITEFLTRVWQSGALFGRTAAEAFYVRIDEELNPAAVRALGQVIIEIGLAPVRPAEYIVIRIGIWDGGSQITEG